MQGETFCFLISLWTKRLESNPRFQEINKNVAGNWWKGPWKSASIVAVSWSIFLCERGSRRKRVWGQRRMRLGAEAVVSGSRGGCRRGEVRWQVGNLSLRGIGDARCETGLRCIKAVGPVWQANPGGCQAARKQVGAASPQMRRSGSYNISKSVGKISL